MKQGFLCIISHLKKNHNIKFINVWNISRIFTESLKYEKYVYKDIYYNDMYFIQEFE